MGLLWLWSVVAAELTLPSHFGHLLNDSLHAKFYVLRPPRELRRLQGRDFEPLDPAKVVKNT